MDNAHAEQRLHGNNMRQWAQNNINLNAMANGGSDFGHDMSYGGIQRKLVLHFDLRNTILVADSVTNIKVEQALNSYLTGVSWGQETKKGGWEWHCETPSLTTHHPDAITYYKHLEKRMVRIPSDRAQLREATGSFTEDAIGGKFRPFYERHLELLRWNHDNFVNDPRLTMTGLDGKPYHYILPSFYKLIHHLHKTNREFSIIIRTYGMDATNVLACTEYCLSGNRHPGFPEPVPIQTNPIPGRITREGEDIEAQILLPNPRGRKSPTKNTFCTDRDIYDMLGRQTGVSGIVDDFRYWQNNGYHYTAGKPIWVDPFDPTVHHIIFDDNARVTDYDSIVDIRLFEADSDQAHSISTQESCRFNDVCVVQADLLESTSNEDYFIHKVKLCEENYSTLVATYASIESAECCNNF